MLCSGLLGAEQRPRSALFRPFAWIRVIRGQKKSVVIEPSVVEILPRPFSAWSAYSAVKKVIRVDSRDSRATPHCNCAMLRKGVRKIFAVGTSGGL